MYSVRNSTTVALALFLLCLLGINCVTSSNLGVEFLGVGYNLLTANPDGGNTERGGVDPGLLYTRKIFSISPGNGPPEVVVEQRHSCARVQETHVFYGTKSYQDKLSLGVKASGGATAAIINFAFSLSGRYGHVKEETTNQHQVFLDDQNVCNLGRARFADELSQSLGFSVSRNFAAAVCGLPVAYDPLKYMHFLDHWGTHVTMEVELGTKNIRRYKSSLSEFIEHVRKLGGADISVGGSYMGQGGSLSVNFQKYKGSDNFQQHFGEYQYSLEAGTPDLPEPISVTVVSLDKAFNHQYWQNLGAFKLQHLCGNTIDVSALQTRQSNVLKAISDYARNKMAHASTDQQLTIPIVWPQGTYGLPKPKTGCPGGNVTWYEGWRYEDFEDLFNHNHVSHNIHLAGMFGDNMRLDYCIKGEVKRSDYDMMWPAGDYCILKYGHCPRDFQEGWVYWNDESGNNQNKNGGTLPDGVYNENTKIDYCCRNDGLPIHAIAMPTTKPFYLMRFTRGCQRVINMVAREETVSMDTEDIWGKDSKGGAHPYIDGDNPTLHYCYYSPHVRPGIVG